jgi:hypothetical protein
MSLTPDVPCRIANIIYSTSGNDPQFILDAIKKHMMRPKCIGIRIGQSCNFNATHGPRCAKHDREWKKMIQDKELAELYDAFQGS